MDALKKQQLAAYSMDKVSKLVTIRSIKGLDLEVGTKMTVIDFQAGVNDKVLDRNGDPLITDRLIVKAEHNGNARKLSIPMNEYFKLKVEDGRDLSMPEGSQDAVSILTQFTISGKENREFNGQKEVYPVRAYADFEKFDKKEIDYAALVSGDLKETHSYSPIQNWTIEA